MAAAPAPLAPGEVKEYDEDGDFCVVCEELPKQSALVPCGHHVLCMACTLSMFGPGGTQRLCPICRAEVSLRAQTYAAAAAAAAAVARLRLC